MSYFNWPLEAPTGEAVSRETGLIGPRPSDVLAPDATMEMLQGLTETRRPAGVPIGEFVAALLATCARCAATFPRESAFGPARPASIGGGVE